MKRKSVGLVQVWAAVLLAAVLLAACGPQQTSVPGPTPAAAQDGRTVTVMTHDSFDVSEQVVAAFQEQCGCQVQFLRSGDAGLMLNQALLSKDNPLADVIYGVDNAFLSRALAGDILEPYEAPALADIPDDLELDPGFRMLPVDFGDVCLNYDRGWFDDHGLAPPASLQDLVRPEYKGLTVVENPATSSPGLAFLLATVGHFGEDGDYDYLDYWAELRANDVLVTGGWEDAYIDPSWSAMPAARRSRSILPKIHLTQRPPGSWFLMGVASARSSSSAFWEARETATWPNAGSTLCWESPSRRTFHSRCLSSPPTARRNCLKSLPSSPRSPSIRFRSSPMPSKPIARPGSRPGPGPCCADHAPSVRLAGHRRGVSDAP